MARSRVNVRFPTIGREISNAHDLKWLEADSLRGKSIEEAEHKFETICVWGSGFRICECVIFYSKKGVGDEGEGKEGGCFYRNWDYVEFSLVAVTINRLLWILIVHRQFSYGWNNRGG